MIAQFDRFEPGAWHDHGIIIPVEYPQPTQDAPKRLEEWPTRDARKAPEEWNMLIPLSSLTLAITPTHLSVDASPANTRQYPQVISPGEASSRGPCCISTTIADRIAQMRNLQPGWLDGEGEDFRPDFLEHVSRFLTELTSLYRFPPPYLYPSSCGEISAEWTFGSWEIDVTFDSKHQTVSTQAVNTSTQESEELPPSTDESALTNIGNLIARFLRYQTVSMQAVNTSTQESEELKLPSTVESALTDISNLFAGSGAQTA